MSTAPIPNFALASFGIAGTYTFDILLADGHDVTSRMGSTALKLNRGTIAAINMSTGAVTIAAAPYNCVVAENCDGTAGAVACLVYMTGRMKADAVVWPASQSHAATTDNLRDFGIYIESVLFRDGLMVKSVPLEEQAAEAKERIEVIRERLKGKAEEPEYDLSGKMADSNWGYLTEEEREKQPELASAEPYDPEKEEEKEGDKPGDKESKPGQHPPPKPEPRPTPPHQEPGKGIPTPTPGKEPPKK